MGQKLTIDFINNKFISRGYILISDKYKNNSVKLKYICKKHPEIAQEISYNNLQQGYGCRLCGYESGSKKRRLGIADINNAFIQKGYTLISEKYTNNATKLKYICPKHPNTIQEITYNMLQRGRGCKFCGIEKMAGENHYNWKGGASDVKIYVRASLTPWKQDSLKANNYQCGITKRRGDMEVHHPYAFSFILQETLDVLNLPLKQFIGEYSTGEIEAIVDKCLELHYKYGLGIPLTPDIHSLFHLLYGKHNNTPEQFEEFVTKWNSGEFKEVS